MTYDVVWPLGPRSGSPCPPAKRPADLNGKVVGELWDSLFRGDEMFKVIRVELRKRYPGVQFVSHEAFGNTMGVHQNDLVAGLPATLAALKCDVVISGVGA
jgi:hypothetical protein